MNEFQFASERLETLVDQPGVCARFGASGNFPVAFRNLVRLYQQYSEHRDTLVSWQNRCAIVSDDQTKVPGWSRCYSSAHEAALAIVRCALTVLYVPAVSDVGEYEDDEKFTPTEFTPIGFKRIPVSDEAEQRQRFERLIAERGKEFDFDLGWIESLKERIRWERAKVLVQKIAPVDVSSTAPKIETTSLDLRALALFFKHPGWNKKQLAESLGCNSRSLAPKRCPKLNAAIRAQKAPDTTRVRRGSRDADGRIEAFDE